MFQKVRKVVGILLLLTAVVITQIPSENVSAYNADFQMNGSTLVKYTGTEQSVSVPDTVKKIGEDAFANLMTIEEVTLPSDLESIAYNAFSGCQNLKRIEIPDEVTEIGTAAFSGCTSLETVSLGAKVSTLGTGVFAGCEQLSEITIAGGNERLSYENGVLYNADQTVLYEMLPGRASNLYTMPSTVEEIKPYAFWGCKNLQTLTVSENVKEISPYAFGNCTELTALELPYSVTSIQMKAFADCVNLQGIYVPESVSFIHETAFDGCNQLQSETEDGTYAEQYFANRDVSDITRAEYEDILDTVLVHAVPEPETEPEENAGDENAEDESSGNESSEDESSGDDSTDPATGDTSGEADAEDGSVTDEGGNTGTNEYYEDPNALGTTRIVAGDAVLFIDNREQGVYDGSAYQSPQEDTGNGDSMAGNGTASDGTEGTVNPEDQSQNQEIILGTGSQKGISFPKYTIVNNELIANQAYYLNTEMMDYQIPETIQAIGEFAFARSNLQSIEIPDSVTRIGYGAFYHCDYLDTVTIPESVTEIEPYAFANTHWLNEWMNYATDTFLIVGDGILLAYKGNRSNVVIPDTVKRIAPQAFKDHTEITAVELPDSLLVVGEEAFAGCTSLAIVAGGKNIEEIRDRAYENCPLTAARIPTEVQTVGLGAYANDAHLGTDGDVAVFQSLMLPTVSYEKSASRLSNMDNRQLAMEGVDVALISNSITPRGIQNTILDPKELGFRGLVISIQTDVTDSQNGTVALRLCTKLPDENGVVRIPDSFQVYGRSYDLVRIDEGAFSYYGEGQALAESSLTDVVMPEAFENQRQQLLQGLNQTVETQTEETITEEPTTEEQITEVPAEEPQVQVNVLSNSLKNQELVAATIAGTEEKLILNITEGDETALAIRNAYESLYGPTEFSNVVGLDLKLTDETGNVLITRLGRSGMTITIPVPISTNAENIHVMCLDENGQLESINHTLLLVNELPCIQFTVTHFSPYAVYEFAAGAEGTDADGTNSDGTQLDASPDTGDFMEPKWFLAIAMVAAGILMLVWKTNWLVPARRKQKNKE